MSRPSGESFGAGSGALANAAPNAAIARALRTSEARMDTVIAREVSLRMASKKLRAPRRAINLWSFGVATRRRLLRQTGWRALCLDHG